MLSGYLHDLRNRRHPPHGVKVWIGAYTPDVPSVAWVTNHRFATFAAQGNTDPINAFAVTFTLYQVLVHVTGHFAAGHAKMTGEEDLTSKALISLWPATPDASWPPSHGFTRDSIAILVEEHLGSGGIPAPIGAFSLLRYTTST